MSASDHISPQLFHGSAHYFTEGELINPTMNYFQKSIRNQEFKVKRLN